MYAKVLEEELEKFGDSVWTDGDIAADSALGAECLAVGDGGELSGGSDCGGRQPAAGSDP